MEMLLKVCTWRNLALAAAAVGVLCAAGRYQEYARRWYRDWRYPPQGSASPAGEELLKARDRHDSAELQRRCKKVAALLDQAAGEGFDVAALRRKADEALQLDDARGRGKATLLLTEVEFAIPHKKVKGEPVFTAGDDDEEIPADVKPLRQKGGKRR